MKHPFNRSPARKGKSLELGDTIKDWIEDDPGQKVTRRELGIVLGKYVEALDAAHRSFWTDVKTWWMRRQMKKRQREQNRRREQAKKHEQEVAIETGSDQ